MANKRPPKKATPEAWSVDDFLADYRPLERVVHITMRGDLIGQLAVLEEELDRARDQSGTGGLGESSDVIALAEQIAALREEVRTTARPFKLVSMGDRAWSDLAVKYPHKPTDGEAQLPWDPELFYPEALSLSLRQPSVTPDQAEKLLETLSAGQVRKLIGALLEVNGGGDELPKSDSAFVLRNASNRRPTTASRGASLDLNSLDG